jgi:hypothetical protein
LEGGSQLHLRLAAEQSVEHAAPIAQQRARNRTWHIVDDLAGGRDPGEKSTPTRLLTDPPMLD